MAYYESQGLVEAPHFTFPGHLINKPFLQNKFIYSNRIKGRRLVLEKLPFDICLYKNMYKFKYLAVLASIELLLVLGNAIIDNLF